MLKLDEMSDSGVQHNTWSAEKMKEVIHQQSNVNNITLVTMKLNDITQTTIY